MGEWREATKGGDAGKEWWRPSYEGEWPKDEPAPGFLIEPLPAPCPVCIGRLWRWRGSNAERVAHRQARAQRAWELLGKRGDPPAPEPIQHWISYRLDCFADAHRRAADQAQHLASPALRPARRVAE
jgi:hypothetical protein